MLIRFIFFLIIIAFLLWLISAKYYGKIGNIFTHLWNNAMDEIKTEEKEEHEHE